MVKQPFGAGRACRRRRVKGFPVPSIKGVMAFPKRLHPSQLDVAIGVATYGALGLCPALLVLLLLYLQVPFIFLGFAVSCRNRSWVN